MYCIAGMAAKQSKSFLMVLAVPLSATKVQMLMLI